MSKGTENCSQESYNKVKIKTNLKSKKIKVKGDTSLTYDFLDFEFKYRPFSILKLKEDEVGITLDINKNRSAYFSDEYGYIELTDTTTLWFNKD